MEPRGGASTVTSARVKHLISFPEMHARYNSTTPRLSDNNTLNEAPKMQDDSGVHARWGPMAVPPPHLWKHCFEGDEMMDRASSTRSSSSGHGCDCHPCVELRVWRVDESGREAALQDPTEWETLG